jgi:hypothetical protein
MISSYWIASAIGVAANLGIADLLADGPKSSDELAQATGSHPRALYRLLRALAGVGVFTEVEPERFGLTPMAEALRADAPASPHGSAVYLCSDLLWRTWSQLGYSVQTGQPALAPLRAGPVGISRAPSRVRRELQCRHDERQHADRRCGYQVLT